MIRNIRFLAVFSLWENYSETSREDWQIEDGFVKIRSDVCN